MDSRTGRLYTDEEMEEMRLKKEDISHFVQIMGSKPDIEHVSSAVRRAYSQDMKSAARAKNKRAKASRRRNR